MRAALFYCGVLFLVSSVFLAGCGAGVPAVGPTQLPGNSTAQVEFSGRVEAINGSQWTVNGQVVQISGQTRLGGNFLVGDEVKVSATVNADGSVAADEIRPLFLTQEPASTPLPAPLAVEPTRAPEMSPTPEPAPTQNPVRLPAGILAPDYVGRVQEISPSQWTIDGQTFLITSATRFTDALGVGVLVRLRLVVNADGSYTVQTIGLAPVDAVPGWTDPYLQVNKPGNSGLGAENGSANENESKDGYEKEDND